MIESIAERSMSSGFSSSMSASADIGRALFTGLIMLLTLIVLVLAPASTAGAISLEREKQTLDLLTTTPISSLAIILGKLLSALSWVFLLLLASIPVTALVFTFGGVGPEDLVRAYVVLFATAIAFGSMGLFVSAFVKRTQAATVINLVMTIVLTAGATFVLRLLVLDDGQRAPAEPGRRRARHLDHRDAHAAPARGAPVLQPVRRPARRHLRHRDRVRRHVQRDRAVTDDQTAINGDLGGQGFGVDHDSFWPRLGRGYAR